MGCSIVLVAALRAAPTNNIDIDLEKTQKWQIPSKIFQAWPCMPLSTSVTKAALGYCGGNICQIYGSLCNSFLDSIKSSNRIRVVGVRKTISHVIRTIVCTNVAAASAHCWSLANTKQQLVENKKLTTPKK